MKRAIWACLGVALFLCSSVFLMWLKSHRSPQIFGKCVHRVNTQQRVVALTFDDGPSEHTEEIVKILKAHSVPATFFLLGRNVEQLPALVRQIYEEGNEIGNHSYTHSG